MSAFVILPMELIGSEQYKQLTAEQILLYALMLNRKRISVKNPKFRDSRGDFIYYSNPSVCEHLRCSKHTARRVLKGLESAELIESCHQNGKPVKYYVKEPFTIPHSASLPKKEYSFSVEAAENREPIDFGSLKNKRRRKR